MSAKDESKMKTAEMKAEEYIKQFLPHVDTTGHWIGFQEGYNQAKQDSDQKLADFKERLIKKVDEVVSEWPYCVNKTLSDDYIKLLINKL